MTSRSVLIITELASAPDFAAALELQMPSSVEIAAGRSEGLAALGRGGYDLVILDSAIAESDPAGADLVWRQSLLAIPMEFNFAIASGVRLAREARAAFARRSREQTLAVEAAASALESDLRSAVTGLLLQSQLALAEPSLPPHLVERLKTIVELTTSIRSRLSSSAPMP